MLRMPEAHGRADSYDPDLGSLSQLKHMFFFHSLGNDESVYVISPNRALLGTSLSLL